MSFRNDFIKTFHKTRITLLKLCEFYEKNDVTGTWLKSRLRRKVKNLKLITKIRRSLMIKNNLNDEQTTEFEEEKFIQLSIEPTIERFYSE